MPMVNFPLESKESRSRISVSKATGKTRVVEKCVNEVDSIRTREQTHMVPEEEEEEGGVRETEDEKEEGEILEEDDPEEARAVNSAEVKVVEEADGAKEDFQGQVSHSSPCDMEVDDRAVAAVDGGKEAKEKSGDRVKHRHRDVDPVKESRSKDAKVKSSDRKHHRDAREDKTARRSLSRDRLKRGRSKSPEQARSRESSREKREPAGSPAPGRERRKRSRSPDSIRAKTSHRHRSRSRESGRERTHGRGRSRSPDNGKEKRVNVDSTDRRRRSVSRDSRCLKGNNESSKRSGRSRSRGRSPSHPEKRRRSRSRDSVRERRGNDDRAGRGGDENRHYRDERSSRDGHHQLGHRDRTDRDKDRDRGYHSDRERRREGDRSRKKRRDKVTKDEQSRDGKWAEGAGAHSHRAREEENQNDYQERVASQLAAQEEDDVEKLKEQSRLRRQAILAKYKKQSQQNQIARETEETDIFSDTQVKVEEGHVSFNLGLVKDAEMPQVAEEANGGPVTCTSEVVELGDKASHASLSFEMLPSANGVAQLDTTVVPGGLGGGSPKSERSTDMFCDDIFEESPAGGHRVGKGDGIAVDTCGLNDNWDDAEGYYCFRVGEILDGRYEVVSSHGRGVFSTVVRARDMKAGRGEVEEVAIKIIRNNETMYKAGQEELVILKKLAGADPENRRHCVRLLSSFVYRNHLCLVFESLHMNLREILKKFGRNIGINLNAVRAYAKQLFIALKHLRNCGVLHCDIKPDNMLVNEAKNVLKLCDFGSAMFAGENEITPYLVSRFYRPPEIILGLPYDHALDIWSVGCCLFELYSGKMLYPGATNNDMLRLHMELMGPFPKKMLKKAAFAHQHFDQDYNFCAMEEDPVTTKTVKRILVNVRPKDMGALISGPGAAEEDTKLLANFKDLLEKIFILDPDKRIAVSQALNHPFITGK